MGFELHYDRESDLIIGKVSGSFDAATAQAVAAKLAAMIQDTGCGRLLNDLTEAAITSSTFDIYSIPRIVSKSGIPISCKRAILIAGSPEDFHFLETASVNVGQQIRMFSDRERALEWLRS
jgi:uncharacterized protein (UPF0276 family)